MQKVVRVCWAQSKDKVIRFWWCFPDQHLDAGIFFFFLRILYLVEVTTPSHLVDWSLLAKMKHITTSAPASHPNIQIFMTFQPVLPNSSGISHFVMALWVSSLGRDVQRCIYRVDPMRQYQMSWTDGLAHCSSQSKKVPRGVGVEWKVTHTTFTQETGVHIPFKIKHHCSFPKEKKKKNVLLYLNFTQVT